MTSEQTPLTPTESCPPCTIPEVVSARPDEPASAINQRLRHGLLRYPLRPGESESAEPRWHHTHKPRTEP